jgi:predicted methyltransferase
MKLLYRMSAVLAVAALLIGTAGAAVQDIGALLDRAIAGDQRSPANKARDAHRHPRETLLFFGLKP